MAEYDYAKEYKEFKEKEKLKPPTPKKVKPPTPKEVKPPTPKFKELDEYEKRALALEVKPPISIAPTIEFRELSEREIEEHLERGELNPLQVTQYFKEGKGKFAIIVPPKPETMTWAEVTDSYVDVLQRMQNDANNFRKVAGYEKGIFEQAHARARGIPAEQMKARLNHAKLSLGIGLVRGFIGTLNPQTYVNIAKDVQGFVVDPAGSIDRRSSEIRGAYLTDPQGFTFQLMGSVIASYGTGRAIGSAWGGVAPKVKGAIKLVGGKLYGGAKTVFRSGQSRFMDAVQGTWLDDAVQAGKLRTEYLRSKPFQHGPVGLWDEFKSYMQLRDDFIKSIPTEAIAKDPGLWDEFSSYMKLRDDFIKSKPRVVGDPGIWDEFKAYMKLHDDFIKSKPYDPGPAGLFTKAKIWWRLHQAKITNNDEWVTAIPKGKNIARLKGTPWYKTGMGMEDMPYPSLGDQARAIDFFKSLADEGAESATVGYYKALIADGISPAKASEMASNYATALTAIKAAKEAGTQAGMLDALDGIAIAIGISASLAKNKKEEDAAIEMTNDLIDKLRDEAFKGTKPIFPNLRRIYKEIEEEINRTGIINEEKYDQLITQMMDEFGIERQDMPLDIDLLVPTIIKPVDEEDVIPTPITKPIITPIPDIDKEPPPPIPEPTPIEPLTIQVQRLEKQLIGAGLSRSAVRQHIRRFKDEYNRKIAIKKIKPSPIPESYRVRFQYSTGSSEIKKVNAKSFKEALSTAQKQRRIKRILIEVEVEKLKR